MPAKPYGMICPITRASEVLQPRWTIPILTELWAGSTKFNELRRGIGSISPALLSKRLKELEDLGLIERVEDHATGTVDYIRTKKAIALEPALNALAMWAQQHIEADTILSDMNVSSLTWKMRRYFHTDELPQRRIVIQYHFHDEGLEYDTYWAVIQPGAEVEMCSAIPGYDVDLFFETNVTSLSAIFNGRTTIARELEAGELFLSGDALLIKTIDRWLSTSTYAKEGTTAMLDPDGRTGRPICAPFVTGAAAQ